MKNEKYLLQVGEKTFRRLNTLNQLYNPFSQQFLLNNGLKPGMSILDLGCGFGVMSCWLAKQVGPKGKVIGIDISPEQCEIAKKNAKKEGVKNIEFIELSVYDLDQLEEQFDLVWGRYILCHLTEPLIVIKKVYQQLTPQGIFCYDDSIFSHIFCYPDNPLVKKLANAMIAMYANQGKNGQIGTQLIANFRAVGFKNIKANIAQPLAITQEEKQIFPDSTYEAQQAFLETGALTAEEYNELVKLLEAMTTDPQAYFGSGAIAQVAGTK